MPYVILVHATFESQANALHVFNQSQAVAVHSSVAEIGLPSERTSHATLAQENQDGSLTVLNHWHLDLFGIVRTGQPDENNPPTWIQPTGAQDAYPALDKRGDETRVNHLGQVWRNTHGNANVWAPGVFGWAVVGD